MKGKTMKLRCASDMNPWIDFVVEIPEEKELMAEAMIFAALERFWASDTECYGDLVEEMLESEGIEHAIVFRPEEHTPEEEAYDRWLSGIEYRSI